MKYNQFILMAVLAMLVLTISGCGEHARTASAERRWDRMMGQARLEAAQESIEAGRLNYAICLLEDLIESESVFADQAKEMLAELRKVTQEFAQAREATAFVTRAPMLY